jgi:hypothetical protein
LELEICFFLGLKEQWITIFFGTGDLFFLGLEGTVDARHSGRLRKHRTIKVLVDIRHLNQTMERGKRVILVRYLRNLYPAPYEACNLGVREMLYKGQCHVGT